MGRVLMSKVESRARGLAVLVLGLVAVVAAIGLWGLDARPGAAGVVGGMTAMSVDMDPAGNTATVLGVNSPCVFVHPDAANGADVVTDVTALGIPAAFPMIGYAYSVGYNATVISVTAADSSFLLNSAQGSSIFAIPDPLPDADGSFAGNAADLGEPTTTAESGSGVLDRLSFHVEANAAAGKYPLTLSNALHLDPINMPQVPLALNSGAIAVDRSCYQGDVDCSNAVNAIDALKILRKTASLSVAAPVGCPFLTNAAAGDVDCSGGNANAIDALKVLRFGAGLPVTQIGPEPDACPDIGT